MTSPLVRAWFAARIAGLADTCCDIWYSFRPELNEFWDTVPVKFRPVDVPAPAGSAVAAGTTPGAVTAAGLGTSPSPALHLMLPCGTCGAHANAPCVTRYGEQTGPHKRRRTAAADAVLGGES